MCGITGFIDLNRSLHEQHELLNRMTDVLSRRGPDGRGTYIDGPVGLGHRRLSIIDLEGGKQPCCNEDGSIWITFNGEIYNFQALREELIKKGHRFSTKSDTETIVHAYEEYGTDCLRHLRGMFAFGIWDAKRQRLFLVRDRVGKKPLYYYLKDNKLIFASEIKAILQDKTVERSLDHEAITDYFTYNYIPFPRSIFKDIYKLPPAHFLMAELKKDENGCTRFKVSVEQYWDLVFQADNALSEQDWIDGLQDKLREAVRLRMISDVPLGAFLSGGVDSSAVVATMASLDTAPIKTFSIGFDEQKFNELKSARIVAKQCGTDHHEFTVRPDALDALDKLTWMFDEPFGDSSALPTYYVSKIARQHVTVILSGDGGDEAFAGYDRYKKALSFTKLDGIPLVLRNLLFGGVSRILPMGTRGKGVLENLSLSRFERSARLRTLDGSGHLAHLLSDAISNERAISNAATTEYAFLEKYHNRYPDLDYLSKLQYEDTKTYLAEDILTKVDRTSMYCSLETRAPFLDHEFLEFAATIPASLKLYNGQTKYILKKSFESKLPLDILYGPKKGFDLPIDQWFKNELKDMTVDLLLSDKCKQRGLLNTSYVKSLLDLQQRKSVDLSARLWSILFFEKWCQNWLDN